MDTKALRQKILDLAIRGKLVPQDPNDEPASVLLERIRAEKQQMVKEGRLKAKDVKNDTIIYKGEDNLHYEKFQDGTVKCIEDEIPFDVPEGWAWCRVCNVINILNGYAFKSTTFTSEGIPVIRISDISDGVVKTENTIFVKGNYDERFMVKKGDLLIAMSGATTGKMGVYTGEEKALLNQRVGNVRINDANIMDPSFRNLYFSSQRINILKKAYGGAQPNISSEKIKELLLPLPPIREQHRIQIIAHRLIKDIDNIENNQNDIHSLIDDAKSKILDLAIRGKLVPQDPNDEPASILLERIRAEKEELIKQGKIKRDKKESIIFRGDDNSYYQKEGEEIIDISDELPFDIPYSWCWGKLKDIVIINPRNKLEDDMEVAFIPMPMIEDGYSGNHTFEMRKWKDIKNGFTHFKDGDVGIAKITPCFENRKSVVFRNLCNGYGAGTTELHVLRPYRDTILPEYLLIYVKTQRFIEDGKQAFSGAVGQQRIGKEYIETVYFPIPPLREQQRIIKHINDLFNYLNVVENALS